MKNEITYTRVGDYLIPDITLKEHNLPIDEPLGRYARMHRAYLREHRTILYNQLLLSEKLFKIIVQIDEAVNERLARIHKSDIPMVEPEIIADLIYS